MPPKKTQKKNKNGSKVDEKVQSKVDEKVKETVDEKVKESVDEKVKESEDEKVKESVDEKVKEPVGEKVKEPVDEKIKEPVGENESNQSIVELQDVFKNIISDLSNLTTNSKKLLNDVKKLEKQVNKEVKDLKKKTKKKNVLNDVNKPKREPSGFAKPSPISDELALFLGMEPGVKMARTEVTNKICLYIASKKLQNPENKRHILLDDALKKLLKTNDNDEVTYFNLQTYMKHHFIKDTSKLNTTVVVS